MHLFYEMLENAKTLEERQKIIGKQLHREDISNIVGKHTEFLPQKSYDSIVEIEVGQKYFLNEIGMCVPSIYVAGFYKRKGSERIEVLIVDPVQGFETCYTDQLSDSQRDR
ncbi:MAG: hypothetical protein HY363_05985 [Candidatus Aenigmarchaeota archaeon]|nr:hypothetical protein [Candidatus Aenigmarchaeota archaeon]